MAKQDGLHFVDGLTGGKRFCEVTAMLAKNSVHLSDEEYGRVLSSVVVACVDVMLICGYDEKVLLGVRLNEPYKGGLAYPGGRMKPGESFEDTASRHVMKNTGLRIIPRRFRYVRTDSWAWSKRSQPPEDAGCHMTGTTMAAIISYKKARQIRMTDDLGELKWLTLQEIVRNQKIHPAHRAAAEDILSGRVKLD